MKVKSSQNEFQQAMFENFGDIKNVLFISDDIYVSGYKEDGSDYNQMLNELKEPGKGTVNINLDKLVTCTTFSHISKDGIKPNQKMVEGITQMQPLEYEKQLSCFLGLV